MELVYVTDKNKHNLPDDYWETINEWARDNRPSYIGFDVVDVSDFTILYDTVGTYKFDALGQEGKDILLFKLKWA